MHITLRKIAAVGALAIVAMFHLMSFGSPTLTRAPAQPTPMVAGALEKTVLDPDVPAARGEFSISADGKRAYFASGPAYYVFDEDGDLTGRIQTKTNARTLALLANGRFLSAQSAGYGHVALLAPDGEQLRDLVTRGASPQSLRQDMTGWTSPCGLAFDPIHRLIFVLDTSAAPTGTPDPAWSRIAVFDSDGKYVREIAAHDGSKAPLTDEYRTWYDDIEVDAKRSVLYVTARTAKQVWAFDYAGTLKGRAPGVTGIAVLPNGNVAVGDPDGRHIRIYDSTLSLLKTLPAIGVLDLEADTAGRLYASVSDPTVLYLRWPANFSAPHTVLARFKHISVHIPFDTAVAGAPFSVQVAASGRPLLAETAWHIFARPSDGSDLGWKELDASYGDGSLEVRPSSELLGLYDIAVRFGKGAISRAEGARDLHVEKTVQFEKALGNSGMTVQSLSDRSAFRRGEPIAVRINARGTAPRAPVTITLEHAGNALGAAMIAAPESYWELPAAVTLRLPPGHYSLSATADSRPGIPYEFELAEAEPASPLQRILYQEFEQRPASMPQMGLLDTAERLGFVRDYLNGVAELGFTRETQRGALGWANAKSGVPWRVDSQSAPSKHDLLPAGGAWEAEAYLDRATAVGVALDTQVLSHCSGVRLAEKWFPPIDGALQRVSQWLGKYPSFYGFNYNDEAFFGSTALADSVPADAAWLDAAAAQLPGRPKADVYRAGLTHMYGEFDNAVTEVRPGLARTATPMWQYPAVEGSYAPTIYAHMTESYSHYLSEGYGWPWYPAHSAEILRRPGLPLMAVFDNGQHSGDGESYLKDALQVLGRGVQGVGVEHTRPFRDAGASNALRLMNSLGEEYGTVFAQAKPDNEAAVLYSYTQDVTERRDALGTPHWERVQALYGAGLMAGLPMSIEYEEDINAGSLLEHGKPRVKFLFLVGQNTALPGRVTSALRAFSAAGGQVVIDTDSLAYPGAVRFSQSLLGPARAARNAYDGDALFPDTQPEYQAIATALRTQFGEARRFAVDTDDPWVSKNRFDGGAIHYVLIASETSPYPWNAASVWSMGATYNKSYQPKRVQLSVPHTPVIYDVFERQVVTPTANGKSDLIAADLRTFPGKLYALAPRELEAPKLSARVSRDNVAYSVNVGLAALVPLRITLSDGHGTVSTFFRASNLRGELEQTIARPAGPGPWRLEVNELLGGTGNAISIPAVELPQPWLSPIADVETEREPQIRRLLGGNPKRVGLVGFEMLPSKLRTSLLQALKLQGVQVALEKMPATPPSAATYVILATMGGQGPGELIQTASQAGLFDRKLSDSYPGVGRGFVSAAFSPRAYGENCIAVVGGDQPGLEAATEHFIALLSHENQTQIASKNQDRAPALALMGAPGRSVPLPKLSERVGIRLSGIQVSGGKLAVAANGYLANLARVDDEGDHAQVVGVRRIGESPTTTSLFVSSDGKSYGLAARTIQRFGEGFTLLGTSSPASDVFTSFGDTSPLQHTFSASGDGHTVLAPGPYGVVAWQHKPSGWQEAWSVDYWKKFDALDWPLAAATARIPSFDTLVPRNGDVALITFAEFTDNYWIHNQAASNAEVSARSLKDGSTRWHFSAPIVGALIYPKLYANSDGSLVLLQAQLGDAGIQVLRYYVLDHGRPVGNWTSDDPPVSVEVSEQSGRIATAYGNGSRLLEVRLADGTVVFCKNLHAQPIAVAFAEDGASVFVSDDAGVLSRLNPNGDLVWQIALGCSAEIARDGEHLYAAGWDGRLRSFTTGGQERWKLDLTAAMTSVGVQQPSLPASVTHEPARPSSTLREIPRGVNLLRSGKAKLTVGGTPGWKSAGTIQLDASTLTNGVSDDVVAPWLTTDEMYWDGSASRKVWAEADFNQPTNVHSLTVYENPKFPESWPTESLVQVWDDARQRWRTAKHAVFLHGPVATYALDLKGITKIRYVPWANYFRNFHTSEIEIR
jgi:hypothetical protein